MTYNSYFQYEYGPSYLDTRHRATVSVVYDLLFLGSSFTGAKAVLAKGWSLASVYYWQSGQPFTVTTPTVTKAPSVSHPTVPTWCPLGSQVSIGT